MAHFPSPNKNDTNVKSLWSLNIATKYDVREKVIKELFRKRMIDNQPFETVNRK